MCKKDQYGMKVHGKNNRKIISLLNSKENNMNRTKASYNVKMKSIKKKNIIRRDQK